MENKLIGRKKEQQILQEALASNEAEMVSVIGRRRVGKTFLVTSMFQNRIVFEITGIQNASRQIQLRNFRDVLSEFAKSDLPVEIPEDWLAAFQILKTYLKPLLGNEKKVIFLMNCRGWLPTNRAFYKPLVISGIVGLHARTWL